eukprot:g13393.t1
MSQKMLHQERFMQDIQRQIQLVEGNAIGVGGKKDKSDGLLNDTNMFVTERVLNALDKLPKDQELYKIQMKHLEAMTKLKFEMQQLIEQQYCSEFEQDLRMQAREHERELNHEEYMANMGRKLRAARLEKMIKKEGGITIGNWSREYDPNNGLTIFFDFAFGIESKHKALQVAYCFALKDQQQTKVRVTPTKECQVRSDDTQQCLFDFNRKVSNVPALENTRCVIELQALAETAPGKKTNQKSIGWCAFDLFSFEKNLPELYAGMWKLPIQSGNVNFHQLNKQTLPDCSHMTAYIRICNHIDVRRFAEMPLEPSNISSMYMYPHYIDLGHRLLKQSRKSMSHKRKARKNITFKCARCNRKFNSKEKLEKHSCHIKDKVFKCKKCKKVFESEGKLEQHEKDQHWFKCNKCTKLFETEAELKIHKKKAHRKLRECKICRPSKKFKSKKKLKLHKKLMHRKRSKNPGPDNKRTKLPMLGVGIHALNNLTKIKSAIVNVRFYKLDYPKKSATTRKEANKDGIIQYKNKAIETTRKARKSFIMENENGNTVTDTGLTAFDNINHADVEYEDVNVDSWVIFEVLDEGDNIALWHAARYVDEHDNIINGVQEAALHSPPIKIPPPQVDEKKQRKGVFGSLLSSATEKRSMIKFEFFGDGDSSSSSSSEDSSEDEVEDGNAYKDKQESEEVEREKKNKEIEMKAEKKLTDIKEMKEMKAEKKLTDINASIEVTSKIDNTPVNKPSKWRGEKYNYFDVEEKGCEEFVEQPETQKLLLADEPEEKQDILEKIEAILKKLGNQSTEIFMAMWW